MATKLSLNRISPILPITILGLFLRLFQLGHDSFWIDEIGVANAARAETITEALRISHHHVMAMPLDYMIAWLFARLNTSEFFLRLPSVLWGTTTIIVCFALFKSISDHKTALMTAFFLAVSPLHIQYSQELRFYAALVFFYLLSTWLLIRAVDKPIIENWLFFTLLTTIGFFFHIYTLFSVTHGIAWLWITHGNDPKFTGQRKFFLRIFAIILSAFLIGFFAFGGVYAYDFPLLLEEKSLFTVIGVGLGWVPFYAIMPILPWIAGCFLFILFIMGIFQSLIKQPLSRPSVLFFSIIIQIAGISLLNYLKGYFLAPRQFLIFLPFMLFFSVLGLHTLLKKLATSAHQKWELPVMRWEFAFVSIFAIISIPALINYYAGNKGDARKISYMLTTTWQPGELILVIPDYEVATYFYYGQELARGERMLGSLYGADWEGLHQVVLENKVIYLIAPYPLDSDRIELLNSLLFREISSPKHPSRYSRSIWLHSPETGLGWSNENRFINQLAKQARGMPRKHLSKSGTAACLRQVPGQGAHVLQAD